MRAKLVNALPGYLQNSRLEWRSTGHLKWEYHHNGLYALVKAIMPDDPSPYDITLTTPYKTMHFATVSDLEKWVLE